MFFRIFCISVILGGLSYSSLHAEGSILVPVTSHSMDVEGSPVYGSGIHKLEYFRDYQCLGCFDFTTRFLPVFQKLAEAGKIQIIFRQYPLSYHQNSYQDALAALCADEQWYYSEYSNLIYALEKKKQWKNISNIERIRIAGEMKGLDRKRFRICLINKKYADRIEKDMTIADSYGVSGIPMLRLDGADIPLDLFATSEELEKVLVGRLSSGVATSSLDTPAMMQARTEAKNMYNANGGSAQSKSFFLRYFASEYGANSYIYQYASTLEFKKD